MAIGEKMSNQDQGNVGRWLPVIVNVIAVLLVAAGMLFASGQRIGALNERVDTTLDQAIRNKERIMILETSDRVTTVDIAKISRDIEYIREAIDKLNDTH